MTPISFLSDAGAELIAGGWSSTRIRFAKFSTSYTALGQDNTVNNLGLGVLAGFGAAQSLQGNASSIGTVLG
jgi:hypothetical protein